VGKRDFIGGGRRKWKIKKKTENSVRKAGGPQSNLNSRAVRRNNSKKQGRRKKVRDQRRVKGKRKKTRKVLFRPIQRRVQVEKTCNLRLSRRKNGQKRKKWMNSRN